MGGAQHGPFTLNRVPKGETYDRYEDIFNETVRG